MIRKGQRFGRLVALVDVGRTKSGNKQWRFQCDCGNTTTVRISDVARRFTQSCGCLQRETSAENGRKSSLTHGMFGTPEYNIWAQMIQRCINPKHPMWKYYGKRGIRVSNRWRKFENFFADMGYRPSAKLSLDRIDNDGNYERSNCRWATRSQQEKNKRQPIRARGADGRYVRPPVPLQEPEKPAVSQSTR